MDRKEPGGAIDGRNMEAYGNEKQYHGSIISSLARHDQQVPSCNCHLCEGPCG